MNFIKKNWQKIFLSFFVFATPFSILYAQIAPKCDPTKGKICNPLEGSGITSIPILIQTVLTGVIRIGIPIIALAIIYCGFLFVAARGSSEKLTEAKDALLYTLIGAAILLGSLAIATMISNTVNALK
ncbi:MAG: hypothetical protein WCP17_00100 [bacterium]